MLSLRLSGQHWNLIMSIHLGRASTYQCFILYYYYYTHLMASFQGQPEQVQKNKTSLDLNETREDGVVGWQWHQLDHMQTVCTSLQTDNHINISSRSQLWYQCRIKFPSSICSKETEDSFQKHLPNPTVTRVDRSYFTT